MKEQIISEIKEKVEKRGMISFHGVSFLDTDIKLISLMEDYAEFVEPNGDIIHMDYENIQYDWLQDINNLI